MGQGIGELLGAYASKQFIQSDNQRVLQGIAQIQGDPTIPPEQKGSAIASAYNLKGLALLQKLQATNLQGLTALKDVTQIGLNQARIKQTEATLPKQALEQEKLKGEISQQPLHAQELIGRIEKLNAEIANAPTETAKLQAQTAKEQAEAELTRTKVSQAQTLAGVFSAQGQGGQPAPAEQIRQQLGLTPEQMTGVQFGAGIGGPSAAASAVRS